MPFDAGFDAREHANNLHYAMGGYRHGRGESIAQDRAWNINETDAFASLPSGRGRLAPFQRDDDPDHERLVRRANAASRRRR